MKGILAVSTEFSNPWCASKYYGDGDTAYTLSGVEMQVAVQGMSGLLEPDWTYGQYYTTDGTIMWTRLPEKLYVPYTLPTAEEIKSFTILGEIKNISIGIQGPEVLPEIELPLIEEREI